MQRSPTATELDKYKPDISQDPVTASKPQTLNKIKALKKNERKEENGFEMIGFVGV